jgi:arsenite-transporting ATPase
MKTNYIFLLGKGGVGKSTLATLTALEFAQESRQILLISLDPAHNLSDITGVRLSNKPRQISKQVSALEINHKKWVQRYLTDVEHNVKNSYRYLSAINLDQYLGILQYSPGIEEYGLLLAFEELKKKYENEVDFMILDMPPTALALRFFTLARLSLTWLDKLITLRNELIKKRELITKIKMGRKEFETDNILTRLTEQQQRYQNVQSLLENSEVAKIRIVVNPENLSMNESHDIVTTLKNLSIRVDQILLNKVSEDSQKSLVVNRYPDISNRIYPQARFDLIGLERLSKYLDQYLPRKNM